MEGVDWDFVAEKIDYLVIEDSFQPLISPDAKIDDGQVDVSSSGYIDGLGDDTLESLSCLLIADSGSATDEQVSEDLATYLANFSEYHLQIFERQKCDAFVCF